MKIQAKILPIPVTKHGTRKDGSNWRFTQLILIEDASILCTFAPITGSVGLVFHEGKMVAIRNNRGWDIPGGKSEEGETPEETLRRELKEEGNIVVKSCAPVAVLKSNLYDFASYLAVYHVQATLGVFTKTTEIFERGLFTVEEFLDRYSIDKMEIIRIILNNILAKPIN